MSAMDVQDLIGAWFLLAFLVLILGAGMKAIVRLFDSPYTKKWRRNRKEG